MRVGSAPDRGARWRAAIQGGYLVLFALFVLWPNLTARPSVLLVASMALAAVWLLGCVGVVSRMPRADELMLCGAFAPVVVGLMQWVYRINFVITHRGLTDPADPAGSAVVFAAVWAVESLLVLLPGVVFALWNARSLAPVQSSIAAQSISSRPVSRSKRT